MIPVLAIARQSAWNRRATLSLVALSIALSTVLLLGFARMRADVRESFSQSVSGTDLIVGARNRVATGWCAGSCTPTRSSRLRARSSSGRATAAAMR